MRTGFAACLLLCTQESDLASAATAAAAAAVTDTAGSNSHLQPATPAIVANGASDMSTYARVLLQLPAAA
jgi:hypothetical protein